MPASIDCPSFDVFIRASPQPPGKILLGHVVLKINQVQSSTNDSRKLPRGAKWHLAATEPAFIGNTLAEWGRWTC